MSGVLMRRNSNLLHALQRQTTNHFRQHPIAQTPHFVGNQTQTRPFFSKFPRFPSKLRQYNDLSPAMFSSSSTTTSSKVGFVNWYLGMVQSRPILTKSVTCGLIYIAADLSSQTIARSSPAEDSYDFWRTSRMAGYGIIILGPSLHFWYNFVSRLFPKRDLISTLKKMFMGQAIYGPVMTVIFFCVNAYLQGENGGEIVARLKRDLVPTLISGVMYWPFCDFITFKFIPLHLQPLMSNSFSYLWTIYLTYLAGLEKVDTALLNEKN